MSKDFSPIAARWRGRSRGLRILATVLVAGAIFAGAHKAMAQVSTCDSLTLYGNAANSGLCLGITPGDQPLWGCSLSTTPDIHTTFNATTSLLIIVSTTATSTAPQCQINSGLTGKQPALTFGTYQPSTGCGVNLQTWVDSLNAVPPVAAGTGTVCEAGFNAAVAAGKITSATAATYLPLCANSGPNGTPCP